MRGDHSVLSVISDDEAKAGAPAIPFIEIVPTAAVSIPTAWRRT
jgi:hypothetical protein